MRTQFNAVALAFLLTATAAMAQPTQQPPALNKSATVRPPAADGTPGMALLGALVLADGTLFSGAGATGASLVATGTYEVDFNRDVSGCYYSAASLGPAFLVELQPRAGVANGVYAVFAKDDGSQMLVNDHFYVTVFCAR